jgi:hypothetical protein
MMMAFLSGFGNSAIYRLKWTFSSISRNAFETVQRLGALFSSEGSYKAYRELIQQVKAPAIPFM